MTMSAPPGVAPSLTVAMSVYNGAEFLDEAIASILKQTFQDFEFLIVDDGSTDGSGDIIARHAQQDRRIRPIHQENRGLVASLNRLVEEARAPLIARMDCDDIALPQRFAQQMRFMRDTPQCGLVGTQVIEIDQHGRLSNLNIVKPLDHEGIIDALGIAVPLCHPSVMMRTALVRSLNGYRPLFRHCEDLDLWLRMGEAAQVRNLPDTLMFYRKTIGQVSSRHSVEQHYGAIFARLAQQERLAGRPDPSDRLAVLPAIDDLDQVFGRAGISADVREQLALRLVYSRAAVSGRNFSILADHVRSGGRRDGLWRAVGRMARMGLPARSAQLAALLLTTRNLH